ncbi:DNA primase [Cobetia sp. 5-25-4-2]|uniref:DNA primase n=1 Tax=Cobetia sp. 5-25-4-2 TaxID=2737459 RepID=UPI001597053D|nr:DNA primase [Cobetia sp. 5-25-4-2]
MAGLIPQGFIDDLLARTDVVEVVGERVQLKKAGKSYVGLCPFHQENSPSFNVIPDKQFYHCFGCGASGSALKFLMEFDRLPFPEAVEQLASRLALEVPREGGNQSPHERRERQRREQAREEGVNLLEAAADFYRQRLTEPAAQPAREYLEGRGLSREVMRDFGIGFAPQGWEHLKHHLSKLGVSEEVQIEYGLLIHHEESGRRYDRFRDRVMFPIRDWKGRTIAFGGRVMGDAKPKYLNSPETPVFHKGRELYGLYEAREANRKLERMLIVEGYMDVVALAQYGIRNACATLGTATSEEHLKRLYRLVDEVVFCFDGDKAGRQAARRALETVLDVMIDGRQARFLFLPEGEDPDSLVRSEGQEAFEKRVTCASGLSEFLFEQAAEGRDLKRMEQLERFVTQALEWISRVPEGVLRSLLLKELERRSGLERERLDAMLVERAAARDAQQARLRQHQQLRQSHSAAPAGNRLEGGSLNEPQGGDWSSLDAMADAGFGEQDAEGWQPEDWAPPPEAGGASGGRSRPAAASNGAARKTSPRHSVSMLTRLLHLLVHEPQLVAELPASDEWIEGAGEPADSEDVRLLVEVVRLLKAGQYRSPQVLLAHFLGTAQGPRLEQLAARELLIPREVRSEELKGLVEHCQHQLARTSPEAEYQALLAKEKQGEKLSAEEKQRLMALLMQLATRR